MAHLGEWTANSSKVHGERHEEYDELFQYICSFAKDFGYDDIIKYEKTLAGYYPTLEFEEHLQPLIDDNDNDVFWNQLSMRLAKRDMKKREDKFQSKDDYMKKMIEIEGQYEDEFENNGLENIMIKESN